MQDLGETRDQMSRDLMKRVENIMNETKCEDYWILVHAKPFPDAPNIIKMKYLVMNQKPSMMLSCMLFHVDKKKGILELCWVLPGDWPTWSVGGTNEPVPETIASYNRLEKKLSFNPGNSFFECKEEEKILA